jgi:hypothetical protein
MTRIIECLTCLFLLPALHAGDIVRTPAWMSWGVDLQARLEFQSSHDFEAGRDDLYGLARTRVWAGFEPGERLRFYFQAQDSRAPGFADPDCVGALRRRLDFRLGYADFGRAKGMWGLRAGRQELAFGDERLVGADNYWDPLGQTFDAVRVTYRRRGLQLDGFGALLVAVPGTGWARPDSGQQLYGLHASLDHVAGAATIEPYLLWKNERGVQDLFTYGVRTAGALPAQLDYNVEMVLQGGRQRGESIRAWAGHWELGVRPLRSDFAPRLSAEYNFASGDNQAGDGHHTTFDDLYPAGYNKYGMSDPFAWRNTRNIGSSVDWSFSKKWRAAVGYRVLRLDAIRDGLYTKGEECLARIQSTSSGHVGSQASVMVRWEHSEKWQIHAGYARFLPGPSMLESGYRGRLSTPFVMVNYRFEP